MTLDPARDPGRDLGRWIEALVHQAGPGESAGAWRDAASLKRMARLTRRLADDLSLEARTLEAAAAQGSPSADAAHLALLFAETASEHFRLTCEGAHVFDLAVRTADGASARAA